jgi:hypothetical protein
LFHNTYIIAKNRGFVYRFFEISEFSFSNSERVSPSIKKS